MAWWVGAKMAFMRPDGWGWAAREWSSSTKAEMSPSRFERYDSLSSDVRSWEGLA